jgi:hypothetical protein
MAERFATGTTSSPRMKTTSAAMIDDGACRTWSSARSSGYRRHHVGIEEGQ